MGLFPPDSDQWTRILATNLVSATPCRFHHHLPGQSTHLQQARNVAQPPAPLKLAALALPSEPRPPATNNSLEEEKSMSQPADRCNYSTHNAPETALRGWKGCAEQGIRAQDRVTVGPARPEHSPLKVYRRIFTARPDTDDKNL